VFDVTASLSLSRERFQVISLFLIAALMVSTVLVLYESSGVSGSYTSLDLQVSPSGGCFKLGVNQSQLFTAQCLNGSAPFNYSWVLTPSGNFSIQVNGEVKNAVDGNSFIVQGQNLTLMYPSATEEFVSVSACVVDSFGVRSSLMPFVVADPYTSSGYKFDASTATASYIVQTDGHMWYRAVKGLDGSVLCSSSNPNTVLTYALGNCSNQGSVYVCAGNYAGASAVVPDGVQFVLEKGATTLSYAVAASATCMIADYQSGLFRYYSTGVLAGEINWASGTTSLVGSWQGSWNTQVLSVLQSSSTLNLLGNLTAYNFASSQPMSDYSFMIYQDPNFAVNGLYNAKAANGTIMPWSSTNVSSIWEHIATNDISISISAGNYYFNNPLHLYNRLIVDFQSGANLHNNQTGFLFTPFSSNLITGCKLNNPYIWCDAVNSGGLYLLNATFCVVNNPIIYYTPAGVSSSAGIQLEATSGRSAYFNTINNPSITSFAVGIDMIGSIGSQVNVNTINGGQITACTNAIYMTYCGGNKINSITIEGNVIGLHSGGKNELNVFDTCHFESQSSSDCILNATDKGGSSVNKILYSSFTVTSIGSQYWFFDNCYDGAGGATVYHNSISTYSMAAGTVVNGSLRYTVIAGDISYYDIKINGTAVINATATLRQPTILSVSGGICIIEWLFDMGGNSYPVTATESRPLIFHFEHIP
jgi:hypothetical protein